MSFIVKGIDLPKEGETVFLAIKGNTAIETHKGINIGYHEAIQIPKWHGKITDVDYIIMRVEDSYKDAGLHRADYYKIKRYIADAPTILEAEE